MKVEVDLDIDDLNHVVIASLQDDYLNAFEKKYKKAAKTMLKYYMTNEEFKEWISLH